MKYIRESSLYRELIKWRDKEISLGNMKKAKRITEVSKKYRIKIFN